MRDLVTDLQIWVKTENCSEQLLLIKGAKLHLNFKSWVTLYKFSSQAYLFGCESFEKMFQNQDEYESHLTKESQVTQDLKFKCNFCTFQAEYILKIWNTNSQFILTTHMTLSQSHQAWIIWLWISWLNRTWSLICGYGFEESHKGHFWSTLWWFNCQNPTKHNIN